MAWLPFKKILLEQMFQSKSLVGTFISDVPKVELDSSEHSGEGLQNPLPWCAWRNSDILHAEIVETTFVFPTLRRILEGFFLGTF